MSNTFLITAIMCDLTKHEPLFNGDYFKVVYNHEDNNVDFHMGELEKQGFRVLSVKSEPAVLSSDFLNPDDRQGNQEIVDGKPVRTTPL